MRVWEVSPCVLFGQRLSFCQLTQLLRLVLPLFWHDAFGLEG